MTLDDPEWPLYIKFSLLRTALSEVILHTYCRAYLCLLYYVTSRDVRKPTVIRIYLGSPEGLRIFLRGKVAVAASSEP